MTTDTFERQLAAIERRYRTATAANEIAGAWRLRLVLTVAGPLLALALFGLFGTAGTFEVALPPLLAIIALTLGGQALTWLLIRVLR